MTLSKLFSSSNSLISFFALLLIPSLWTLAFADSQNDQGVIAYVSPGLTDSEIRLINPDGTQDRTLWGDTLNVAISDRIGALSWHPDGTKLAFDSGHEWQRSMSTRDIYTISVNGTNLHRVTNAALPDDLSDYPTGTVKFKVRADEQGDVQIYVEGATEPVKYFAREAFDYTVTLTVADFGEGVRQVIRLWDPDSFYNNCRFSEESWVDVIPGQEVDLGKVPFDHSGDCLVFYTPSWFQDGNNLVYLQRHLTDGFKTSIEKASISTGPRDSRYKVHEERSIKQTTKMFRAVAGPTEERKDDILYLYHSGLYDFIYYITTDAGARPANLNIGSCQITCSILDIAWLPDGSGFVISRREQLRSEYISVLYRYTFAERALEPIIRLSGKIMGKLSISPSGDAIVFERGSSYSIDVNGNGPGLYCPCSIWRVNMDGSDLHQLVEDGRAPAWGKTASVNIDPPTDNTEPSADFIERLYVNILGRASDRAGLAHWVQAIHSSSATKIAFGFFNSEEFRGKNLDNAEFVKILYKTILNRNADSAGLDYWVSELENGLLPEFILYGFFQSTEFSGLARQYGVTAYSDGDHSLFLIKDFVKRFYFNVLSRDPESDGLEYWSGGLSDGSMSASGVAEGFFSSNEFINQKHDNGAFIEIAYQTILNRAAEQQGKGYWQNELANGLSRKELIKGFIDSQEFSGLAAEYGIQTL
jgi:Tol biopolymer transport system component